MKKPQLIAVGIILLGLLFFGVGVYLLAKENTAPAPVASNSPASTPYPAVPVTTSNKAKPKPTTTREPAPEIIMTPTPEPRKPSSVQWISRDSFYGGNTWKVVLTSSKWFDTGIPYVTNDTLNINEYGSLDTNTGALIKVNGNVLANKDYRQVYYFDSAGYSPSLRDTVKLKLEDGAKPVELEITVIHVNAICTDDNNHRAIHEASIAWADTMVSKTKR